LLARKGSPSHIEVLVLSVQYLPNSKTLIMYKQVQLWRLLQIPAYKFLLASANDSLQRVQTYAVIEGFLPNPQFKIRASSLAATTLCGRASNNSLSRGNGVQLMSY